jgi:hypothetical protein
MQHLPFPASAADDEAVIMKIGKKPDWEPYEAAWIARYQAYPANGGSPFVAAPHMPSSAVTPI